MMKIHYPDTVKEIPSDRSEELAREILHFLQFSPCKRLRYVEKEWNALKNYIERFGIQWNRKSS